MCPSYRKYRERIRLVIDTMECVGGDANDIDGSDRTLNGPRGTDHCKKNTNVHLYTHMTDTIIRI